VRKADVAIDEWMKDIAPSTALRKWFGHDPDRWQEFRRRCRAANPEAYLVGEIWYIAPDWLRGDRFDALMNYPLAQAILGYAAGDSLDEEVIRSHNEFGAHTSRLDGPGFAARVMELNGAYDPAVVASQLNLLDSHDAPRFLTMAGGDRDAYRMAVLLQATLPGAPCVYYGDEIGMEGRNDPDCRRSFPWDEARQDVDLLAFVRAAFAVRNAEPALRRGSLRVAAADRSAVAFERADDGGRLVVAVNAGPEPVCLTLDEWLAPGITPTRMELPGWSARVADAGPDGRLVLELPARSGYLARLS